MAYTNATVSANVSIGALSSEAEDLFEQAKKYRAAMELLKADDPQRALYEQVIIDLLRRAERLANSVVTSTSAK